MGLMKVFLVVFHCPINYCSMRTLLSLWAHETSVISILKEAAVIYSTRFSLRSDFGPYVVRLIAHIYDSHVSPRMSASNPCKTGGLLYSKK